MSSRLSICVVMLAVFLPVSAQCVTFDCSKAKSFAEKAVCSNSDLSQKDDELYDLFKQARDSVSDKQGLKKLAYENWKKRETCKTLQCVRNWYDNSFRLYSSLMPKQYVYRQTDLFSIFEKAYGLKPGVILSGNK